MDDPLRALVERAYREWEALIAADAAEPVYVISADPTAPELTITARTYGSGFGGGFVVVLGEPEEEESGRPMCELEVEQVRVDPNGVEYDSSVSSPISGPDGLDQFVVDVRTPDDLSVLFDDDSKTTRTPLSSLASMSRCSPPAPGPTAPRSPRP